MAKKHQNAEEQALIRGVVAVLAIVCGTHIIESGYEISGYITMFGLLSTLVGVFVYGKRASRKELIEKQKLMMGDSSKIDD